MAAHVLTRGTSRCLNLRRILAISMGTTIDTRHVHRNFIMSAEQGALHTTSALARVVSQ